MHWQGCPWDIFICSIPSHSNLYLSHPMGFPLHYYNINMEYNSIKIIKFMKVQVSYLLNRTTCTKRHAKRQNLLTLKFRSIVKVWQFSNILTLSISESHGKYKCVLFYPIPWDISHWIPIGMTFPWASLCIDPSAVTKVGDHCLRVYLSKIYFLLKHFWDTNNFLSYV